MNNKQKEELIKLGPDRILFNCSMKKHTTFHVGGPAEAVYAAHNLDELRRLTAYLIKEGIPYLAAGRGSNLLVRDGGLEGVVILLRGELADFRKGNNQTIAAGAGGTIAGLLDFCRKSGLGGLEFLAGIPGTVGGAVMMNAGAFGKETGSRIRKIGVITPRDGFITKAGSELVFSYRKLKLENGSVIINACFNMEQESKDFVAERIKKYLKKKKKSQPLEYPSAGSVFMNPPNDYAGRLIEKTGLKGKRVGGAMISNKHANFIVNTGSARAEDIIALMRIARDSVKKETGIDLQTEIQIAGF